MEATDALVVPNMLEVVGRPTISTDPRSLRRSTAPGTRPCTGQSRPISPADTASATVSWWSACVLPAPILCRGHAPCARWAPCPAGSYGAATGLSAASACSSCPANKYSVAGVSTCTSCPANSWSAAGAGVCTANAGYYKPFTLVGSYSASGTIPTITPGNFLVFNRNFATAVYNYNTNPVTVITSEATITISQTGSTTYSSSDYLILNSNSGTTITPYLSYQFDMASCAADSSGNALTLEAIHIVPAPLPAQLSLQLSRL